MKIIKYKFLSSMVNYGPEENPKYEPCFIDKELNCPTEADLEANLPIAQAEAYNGEYPIEGEFDYPVAPHNILKGEYVTIGGVLYKATGNIPNGEKVIEGQNAVQTTYEEQLYELKGE